MTAPPWVGAALDRLEGDARLDPLVRSVGEFAAPLAAGRRGELLQGRWLGHALHPLLTDFPLGCWMSANLLDLLGGRSARRSAQRLVGLGLLGVPLTAASGASDLSTVTATRTRRVGVVHAAGNSLAALCFLGSWRARRRGRHARGVLYGLLGSSLTSAAGYLGGHLSLARRAGTGERGLGLDEPVGTIGGEDAPIIGSILVIDTVESEPLW